MTELPDDLLVRIAGSAHDPARRTYLSGAAATAQPVDLTALLGSVMNHGSPQAQGLVAALQQLGLDPSARGPLMMGPAGPLTWGASPAGSQALPLPPTEEQLSRAESELGRPLPAALRETYGIADGGFGPGAGLFSLAELVRRYAELTAEPFGPAGQDWPARLLPVFDEDPVLVCLDLDSGAVVDWDPEEIEDEDDDADWHRSFKPAAPTLAALWEDWLDRPTFADLHVGRG